jgi:hypothetical protein
MSLREARARLGEQQTALVRALVGGGEPPAGFDAERLRLAASSLINKRIREVSRAWPALARALGKGFAARFRAFALTHPPPQAGGPLMDGLAFATRLAPGELDDSVRLEMVRARLAGARFGFASVRLGQSRRLVLGVRLPGLGARLIALPWWV